MGEAWAVPSASAKYGGALAGGATTATRDATGLHGVATLSGRPRPLSPSSGLFWFGLIAAVSVGLMAASTTVRVGKGTASLNVGKA